MAVAALVGESEQFTNVVGLNYATTITTKEWPKIGGKTACVVYLHAI